jgi:hypothetical protein
MNDYAHGALEALAWTFGLLQETEDLSRIRRQIEGAKDDLLAGVSINFRQRLKGHQSAAGGFSLS